MYGHTRVVSCHIYVCVCVCEPHRLQVDACRDRYKSRVARFHGKSGWSKINPCLFTPPLFYIRLENNLDYC